MSVSKSALHSRAARFACSTSAPHTGASAAASSTNRPLRSFWVPSLLWYTTLPKPGRRLSSVFLRSWSKKNFASARRARNTRSLPVVISSGVGVSRFDTSRKRFFILPCWSVIAKYFWLACMVKIKHSCGTSRNSFSKPASYTTGHSTSAHTSSINSSGCTTLSPAA